MIVYYGVMLRNCEATSGRGANGPVLKGAQTIRRSNPEVAAEPSSRTDVALGATYRDDPRS